MVFAGVSLFELYFALKKASIVLPLPVLVIASCFVIYFAYKLGMDAAIQCLIISMFTICLYCALDKKKPMRFHNALAGIFALIYIPFLLSFAGLLLAENYASLKIAYVIVVCVASDTGGWLLGRLIGKHKMSKVVSPKKTWEGLLGSFLLAIGVSYLMLDLIYPKDFFIHDYSSAAYMPLLLGIAGVVFGTLGDLTESLIKRSLGVKDMGDTLKGHGGFLDRIDSILFALPAMYFIMLLMM
jgi:phosphatidate cytidylyltransferase